MGEASNEEGLGDVMAIGDFTALLYMLLFPVCTAISSGFVNGVAGLVARPVGRLAKPGAGGFIPPDELPREKAFLLFGFPVV